MAALVIAIAALGMSLWQSSEATKSRLAAERSADAASSSVAESRKANALTEKSLEIARAGVLAADKQASAALAQVSVGTVANREARDANRRTTEAVRAKVIAKGVTLKRLPSAGTALEGDVFFENAGQVEALNVRVRSRIMIDKGLPDGAMPTLPEQDDASVAVVAPQKSVAHAFVLHQSLVTPGRVAALQKGDVRLYLYGVLTYDSLGVSHETEFCFAPSVVDTTSSDLCRKWNTAR